MKKGFTISVALIFIASMSFAQANSNSVSNDYAYASHFQKMDQTGFFSNNIILENPDNKSANVESNEKRNGIELFPMLAHFTEKIIIKNLDEPCDIQIRDYAGRLVQKLSSTGNSVQINNLKNGNYFVNITGIQSGNVSVKKLSVIN